MPRTASIEMFNRHAIGVRAHAGGVGVKLANLSFMRTRDKNDSLKARLGGARRLQ